MGRVNKLIQGLLGIALVITILIPNMAFGSVVIQNFSGGNTEVTEEKKQINIAKRDMLGDKFIRLIKIQNLYKEMTGIELNKIEITSDTLTVEGDTLKVYKTSLLDKENNNPRGYIYSILNGNNVEYSGVSLDIPLKQGAIKQLNEGLHNAEFYTLDIKQEHLVDINNQNKEKGLAFIETIGTASNHSTDDKIDIDKYIKAYENIDNNAESIMNVIVPNGYRGISITNRSREFKRNNPVIIFSGLISSNNSKECSESNKLKEIHATLHYGGNYENASVFIDPNEITEDNTLNIKIVRRLGDRHITKIYSNDSLYMGIKNYKVYPNKLEVKEELAEINIGDAESTKRMIAINGILDYETSMVGIADRKTDNGYINSYNLITSDNSYFMITIVSYKHYTKDKKEQFDGLSYSITNKESKTARGFSLIAENREEVIDRIKEEIRIRGGKSLEADLGNINRRLNRNKELDWKSINKREWKYTNTRKDLLYCLNSTFKKVESEIDKGKRVVLVLDKKASQFVTDSGFLERDNTPNRYRLMVVGYIEDSESVIAVDTAKYKATGDMFIAQIDLKDGQETIAVGLDEEVYTVKVIYDY